MRTWSEWFEHVTDCFGLPLAVALLFAIGVALMQHNWSDEINAMQWGMPLP